MNNPSKNTSQIRNTVLIPSQISIKRKISRTLFYFCKITTTLTAVAVGIVTGDGIHPSCIHLYCFAFSSGSPYRYCSVFVDLGEVTKSVGAVAVGVVAGDGIHTICIWSYCVALYSPTSDYNRSVFMGLSKVTSTMSAVAVGVVAGDGSHTSCI